ncbi:MAG TPA: cell division protein ZapA [Parafilimonas sp.]|nr:cell division protein ZapA [Parafilimonas sp.]
MEELIPVNILVGDRNYRLKIKPSDEENLRKTIKLVNNKLIEFKTNFAGKDMQDYIAMVLIWLATEQPATALSNEDFKTLSEKLKILQQMVESAL